MRTLTLTSNKIEEQFKFINFTNLNITASALYLIAAPSTHKEARAEEIDSTIQIFVFAFDLNVGLVDSPQIVSWRHLRTALRGSSSGPYFWTQRESVLWSTEHPAIAHHL